MSITAPQLLPLPPMNLGSLSATHARTTGDSSIPVSSVDHLYRDAHEQRALETHLQSVFKPYLDAKNRAQIEEIIVDRANKLQAMGQTPESFEAAMSKASRLDWVTAAATGFVRAGPFAAASAIIDTVPALTAKATSSAMTGFIAGAFSGLLDTVGTGVMDRATVNRFWLKAPADKLEPVMAKAMERKQPTALKKVGDTALAIQTYTLRNAVRTGVAAVVTARQGADSARRWDTGVTALGGLIANAGFASRLYQIDRRDDLAGPAFLLARTDWEDQYRTLLDTNALAGPIANGSKVLGSIALNTLTDSLQALGSLAQAGNLVKNGGALGGGFAAISAIREQARNYASSKGATPAAVAAVDHAVNTFASAGVFPAWTTADVLVGPNATKAAELIQRKVPEVTHAITHAFNDVAIAGADSVSGTFNKLFNRRPHARGNAQDSDV